LEPSLLSIEASTLLVLLVSYTWEGNDIAKQMTVCLNGIFSYFFTDTYSPVLCLYVCLGKIFFKSMLMHNYMY